MRKSTHTAEYAALRLHLSKIRKAAGFTQRRLAKALQVPHSWVAKVENGERRIDLVEFAWFSAACGGSPDADAAELLRQWTGSRRARRPRAKGGRP